MNEWLEREIRRTESRISIAQSKKNTPEDELYSLNEKLDILMNILRRLKANAD